MDDKKVFGIPFFIMTAVVLTALVISGFAGSKDIRSKAAPNGVYPPTPMSTIVISKPTPTMKPKSTPTPIRRYIPPVRSIYIKSY